MWPDRIFAIGVVLLVLVIVRFFNATVDRSGYRSVLPLFGVSLGMIAFAGFQKPGGYDLQSAPEIVLNTFVEFF